MHMKLQIMLMQGQASQKALLKLLTMNLLNLKMMLIEKGLIFLSNIQDLMLKGKRNF